MASRGAAGIAPRYPDAGAAAACTIAASHEPIRPRPLCLPFATGVSCLVPAPDRVRGLSGVAWRGAALGLLVLQGAQAQPAAPQRVEVTGSVAADRRDQAAGQQVVTGEELARQGHTRLADALRRVPGLQVRGSGAELSLQLDGLSAEQTLVLLNGEPVPRLLLIEALSVGQVERIEIVRGANVQWSGRGLAGTINIVTTRTPPRAQRDLTLTLGSHFGRPVGQAELALGERQGGRGWRLVLALRGERERYPTVQSLRFAPADGTLASAYRVQLLEASRDDGVTLTPQWQWSGDGGQRLQLEGLLSASRFAGAAEESRHDLLGLPPRMQSDRLSYRHDRTLARLRTELQWPLSPSTRANASAAYTRGRRDQASLLVGQDVAGLPVRDSAVESTRIDHLLNARLALEHRLGGTHVLAGGVQLEGNRRLEDRQQRERIPSWEPEFTDERYDADARSVALYLQDDWLPTRPFTLSWGARLERLHTRSTGNVFDGVSRQHQLSSPMLNMLWRPDARTQWTLGLSRAFRLPEPRDIMPRRWTRPENSSLVPDFFGNPALVPESAWTLQGGWERRLDEDTTQLQAGVVVKRVSDLVLQELVQVNERYLLRPRNGGQAWVASVNARAQAEWRAPWGDAVALGAGVTARQSRLDGVPGPDNRLPDQSPWEAQAEASQRAAEGAWSLSASWRWRAGYRARGASGRLLQRSATHGLDLAATWQVDVGNRWRLALQAPLQADDVEITRVQTAAGVDELQARTRREPRLTLQWMHRL